VSSSGGDREEEEGTRWTEREALLGGSGSGLGDSSASSSASSLVNYSTRLGSVVSTSFGGGSGGLNQRKTAQSSSHRRHTSAEQSGFGPSRLSSYNATDDYDRRRRQRKR